MTRFPDPQPGTDAHERHVARLGRIRAHIEAAKAALAVAKPAAPYTAKTWRKPKGDM